MSASAAVTQAGMFEGATDIGPPGLAGSALYDAARHEYLVAASGGHGAGGEHLHFVWKRMRGDFIVRAHVRFDGEGDPRRELGWMIRAGLEPDAPFAAATVRGDGLSQLRARSGPDGEREPLRSTVTAPEVLQLERRGRSYTMSVAAAGETFSSRELGGLDLADEVYVGLFVRARHSTGLARAAFGNVRVVVPAPTDFVPYRDYIGSRLEILDVDTGAREVVHTTHDSLQAPNWTPDGRALIYNRNGLLYRFDLESRTSSVIDTSFATANNNDHVLSFDGRRLGISHHPAEHEGRSIIYTLPATGGTPVQVTRRGPSYLHGWSPDGEFLVYTAERGGRFDIYRIPAAGGEERQLTDTPTLDDGSEYSPDGKLIYFNSARSGTMEIWRMGPEGESPEQLTDDAFQNWFPHVSPNGRRIVFLSYPPHVDAEDHPFYQHVYLRLMDADGGPPRVVAWLYGGQGTINVPSWAPDGRRLAFVSNSAEP